ncbi:MAG TPA: tail fiber domain-containing protein, partial [Bacteroidales bacterium]|nr:tail fiber domain-containing protein [Bacteroidales bacterium]
GTSLLLINDNGNIGINTTLPGATLDIKGGLKITETGPNNGYVGFFAAPGSGATFYTWPATDGISGQVLTTNGSGYLSWTTPGGGSSGTTINCSTSSNSDYTIRGDGSGTWECTNALRISSSGYVSINTSPTSSYRLRVNGNLGLGSSPPSSSYTLSVDGDSYLDGGVRISNGLGVGTSNPSSGLYVGSSSNFYVPTSISSSSGTELVISSGRIYKLSSSIRFKENIQPLTFDKNKFFKLTPVIFNYKKEYGNPNKKEVGLIAEEVEKLIPELVVYEQKQVLDASGKPVLDENGQEIYENTNIPESVKYNIIPLYLISIVAEQDQKINTMTQQIQELQSKINTLENLIYEMKSNKK